ncbi:MAG: hypothetical protein J7K84_01985 [Deltaproteobacteria bacterium]|nr:hypothetical protein [Deltaproteobacteria bacterium]
MIFCFYAVVIICLVITQTVIMAALPFFDSCYDILIPFIIYLGLFRSLREGLPVVLLSGFLLDGLSGAAFGLYTTTYIWLYICCRWIIGFFHAENIFILIFAVVSGVILQNLIFLSIFFILEPGSHMYSYILNSLQIQLIGAFITGPFFLLFFKHCFMIMEKERG